MNIGEKVLIEGDHPHAGKVGKIKGVYFFKHGLGSAINIDFPDGDGCFVFANDRNKVKLREVRD